MQDEQRSMLSIHIKRFMKKHEKIDFTKFYNSIKRIILIKYIFIIEVLKYFKFYIILK